MIIPYNCERREPPSLFNDPNFAIYIYHKSENFRVKIFRVKIFHVKNCSYEEPCYEHFLREIYIFFVFYFCSSTGLYIKIF